MKKLLSLVLIFATLFIQQSALAATDVKNDAGLPTSLISYWELEESSGTRTDSHGTNNLTDNNTVGVITGIQGNGADFERSNSEVFSAADSASLDITGDWSFQFWIKLEQLPGTAAGAFTHYEKFASGNGIAVLTFGHSTLANDLRVQFSNAGSNSIKDYDLFWVAGDVGVWRHIVVTVDVSAGATGISVYKDGTLISGTNTANAATSVGANTSTAYIGASNLVANFTDGVMDEVGLWGRIVSSTEVSELRNSGAGIPYDAGGGAPPRRIIFAE